MNDEIMKCKQIKDENICMALAGILVDSGSFLVSAGPLALKICFRQIGLSTLRNPTGHTRLLKTPQNPSAQLLFPHTPHPIQGFQPTSGARAAPSLVLCPASADHPSFSEPGSMAWALGLLSAWALLHGSFAAVATQPDTAGLLEMCSAQAEPSFLTYLMPQTSPGSPFSPKPPSRRVPDVQDTNLHF